jgi:Ca-activated chloride channel family protein
MLRLRRCVSALVVALAAATNSLADGLIVIDSPVHVPHGHYRFAPLEVRQHHVNVAINDQIATTTVDQTFYNPNERQLEGHYIFPIPIGAHIDTFTMEINGKPVEAELLDAPKARQLYEDIVRRMKDPALLEYAGQGLFKARIFPIEPHVEKRVSLKYTELLRNDGGLVGYLYPLNTEKFSAQPLQSVSVKCAISCKDEIKSVYSPSHDVEVTRQGPHKASVGFESSNIRPDTDFQVFYSPQPPSGGNIALNLLSLNDGSSDGGYFLLLASPGDYVDKDQVLHKDIVFVLDTSGSMAGEKMEQARRALRFCLNNLNDGDRFEIIRFSTEAEALFGHVVEASKDNRDKAEAFIKDLKAIGGTAIEDALVKAVKTSTARSDGTRPSMIVFLTDGRPTVGNTHEDAILSTVAREIGDRTTRIFCFGIGTDINTHLLDKVTEKTRAASQYVLPEEDIEVKVSNFYTKINVPVLANLELNFGENVRVTKMYPPALPDLFKGDQLVLLGRYQLKDGAAGPGNADAAITLTGTVNGAKRTFTDEATFATSHTEHSFIPKLWATRRVGYLLDEIRLHGDNAELRDEIVILARQHGIVTPYTSYLILEDEAGRNIPIARRTLQRLEEGGHGYGGGGSGGGFAPAAERGAMGGAWDKLREAKTGDAGVAPSQSNQSLKDARSTSGLALANVYAERDNAGIARQQTRAIRGKTFFQNGDLWIDSDVQSRADARRIQLVFGSDDYFKLLTSRPDIQPWLSVGENVQLIVDDTIYEIAPAS